MIHGWIWPRSFFPVVSSSLFFALLFTFSVSAGEVLYSQRFSSFTPPVTSGCSLKSFSVSVYDQGHDFSEGEIQETSRGAAIGTVVETTEASCIREFSVVQFIKGCVYDIEQNERTGMIERTFSTAIQDSSGVSIPFKFDRWTVDSLDPDPMYESASARSVDDPRRFDNLLYPKVPLRLDGTQVGLSADRKVMLGSKYRGFVRDLQRSPRQMFSVDVPVAATWSGDRDAHNSVTNVSLEFKVCLYRTKDVPQKADPKSFEAPTEEGGPLHCFDWASRNEFDFNSKKFISKRKIDPFCLKGLVNPLKNASVVHGFLPGNHRSAL